MERSKHRWSSPSPTSQAFPESEQIEDVSRFHPTRKGDGVALDAILDLAGIEPTANYADLARRP